MSWSNNPTYHVLLEGRSMGPYDRRTIVGMRIKKTLTSDNVLLDSNGNRLSVGDLLGRRAPQSGFNASRSGAYSVVQATYAASLVAVRGKGGGFSIPAFRGEIEARVQADVLRIAGRFRRGLGWRDDRIKIPLRSIAHARVAGSRVDLWLAAPGAAPGGPLTQLSLELFSVEAAAEFVDWLPDATPVPEVLQDTPGASRDNGYLVWIAVIGAVSVLTLLGLVLVFRRALF